MDIIFLIAALLSLAAFVGVFIYDKLEGWVWSRSYEVMCVITPKQLNILVRIRDGRMGYIDEDNRNALLSLGAIKPIRKTHCEYRLTLIGKAVVKDIF